MLGLTRLPYRPNAANHRAAVNDAALQIEDRVRSLGPRHRGTDRGLIGSLRTALDRELDVLCDNAVAQGWTVKTNSPTTLRLRSPRGRAYTLAKGQPDATRTELRRFAAQLRAAGLRVNSSLRRPIAESPFL